MAFNNLGLQEPSTITARVATVTISRGSTSEHQEIMVIGDAQTSNAIVRVVAAPPASTEFGMVVRIAGGPSSVADLAVRAVLSSTSADNPVTASQGGTWTVRANLSSTSADNPVTASQAGTWNVGTVTTVSSLAGIVAVRPSDTNWASSAGFHFNSSGEMLVKDATNSTIVTVAAWGSGLLSSGVAAGNSSALTVRNVWSSTNTDQPVSAAQAGVWNVSSLAGIVAVRPSDTNWASSAGFHFNSSGELQVVGTFMASTTVNVSSLAGRVAFAGYHASGSIVNVTDSTNNAINVNVVAGSAAGSTITTVSQLLDSSGGSITAGDSANQAIRVNVVAGAAGGSTIVTVSTGSVRVHQSSAADLLATVSQASTVWAVQLSNYSTTVQVSSVAGTVSVAQASTVWAVQLSNYSTIAAVSSVGGIVTVTPQAGSTWTVRPVQSSQADLRVTVYQSSAAEMQVTARNADGVGNALESATSAPSSGARGLLVRPILGGLTTYSASTTGQSSATTIQSSAATNRAYVFAYSITSTLAGPVQWGFYDGTTQKWGGVLAATSSAISGVNLAVSPPGYLFAGSTGQALTFNCATSNAGLNVSVAYWVST